MWWTLKYQNNIAMSLSISFDYKCIVLKKNEKKKEDISLDWCKKKILYIDTVAVYTHAHIQTIRLAEYKKIIIIKQTNPDTFAAVLRILQIFIYIYIYFYFFLYHSVLYHSVLDLNGVFTLTLFIHISYIYMCIFIYM